MSSLRHDKLSRRTGRVLAAFDTSHVQPLIPRAYSSFEAEEDCCQSNIRQGQNAIMRSSEKQLELSDSTDIAGYAPITVRAITSTVMAFAERVHAIIADNSDSIERAADKIKVELAATVAAILVRTRLAPDQGPRTAKR